MNKIKAKLIYDELYKLYPDAVCFLNHKNEFELVIAVMLSAQTTDERVNSVTPYLFDKFPDVYSLALSDFDEVFPIIKSLGLAKSKANNMIALAKKVVEDYNGIIPNNFNDLCSLPGVGRKTANVVLANAFNVPTIAVDTHVYRVSYRLGFRKKDDDLLTCELKLQKYLNKDYWIKMHHMLILFGRNYCKAQNPKCDVCPLKEYCKNR